MDFVVWCFTAKKYVCIFREFLSHLRYRIIENLSCLSEIPLYFLRSTAGKKSMKISSLFLPHYFISHTTAFPFVFFSHFTSSVRVCWSTMMGTFVCTFYDQRPCTTGRASLECDNTRFSPAAVEVGFGEAAKHCYWWTAGAVERWAKEMSLKVKTSEFRLVKKSGENLNSI